MTLSLPYRTAGNTNHTTKRLFSAYNYMADPLSATFAPAHTAVNPFTRTTLPMAATLTSSCSAPTPSSSPSRAPTTPPLYFAPLTPQSTAAVQVRQHTAPTSGRGRSVAPCYELERSWLSEPYVEQAYSSLYRAVRADRHSTEWKATNATGGEFDQRTLAHTSPTPHTRKQSKPSTARTTRRVQHLDAWNVADGQGSSSVGGRHCSDSRRMAGGVDKYESSPFEASERLMSALHATGMRSGHRSGMCVGSGHSHANVKVAGSGLRDEKRYHSRRSADGLCNHHCSGVEVKTSSV